MFNTVVRLTGYTGIPLYGRAFEDTTGLGAPYNGVGPGTLSAGIYSYSDLPLAGAQVYENLTDVSSYSYDPTKMELVSYDTPHIASLKAQYVSTNGLAGNMFWDVSSLTNILAAKITYPDMIVSSRRTRPIPPTRSSAPRQTCLASLTRP